MADIGIDQGDCLFHLVDLGADVENTFRECLGQLGLVGVCFSGFDEYIEAIAMPSFIFPLAIFCRVSDVSRARSVQRMLPERRIRLVALAESASLNPEELLSFCMVLEPPYTPEKVVQCASALLKCGIFTRADGIICEQEIPYFHPRVEGWQCPLRAGIDSSVA